MVFSYDELKGVLILRRVVCFCSCDALCDRVRTSWTHVSCQWFRENVKQKRITHTHFFLRESDSCNWNYCCAICGLRTCEGIFSSPVVWGPFQPSVVPWWRVSCAPSLPFPRVRRRGEFYLHLKMVLSSTCLLWCPDSCRLPPPQANVASRCLCAAAVKCPSPCRLVEI